MELWRTIGAVVVGTGGLLLVLVAMAQVRDNTMGARRTGRESTAARVARAAAIGLVAVAVAVVLVLTVLPPLVVWAVAATGWLILLALFLVD